MSPERALASMLRQGGADFSPRDVVAFTKLAEGLSAAQTLEEVLWAVAHEALGTMQLEDVVIYLVDQAREVCVQAAAYGPKNPEGRTIKAPMEIPVGKGVVGRVARSGQPALIPDVSIDPDYIPDDVTRLCELTVPIIVDGEVIGVIDSEHSIAGFFTPRHQTVFTAIARLAAPRIEQFQLRARLEAAGDARLWNQVQRLERRFAREQKARREAERLLETKSRELYDLNQVLARRATGLEAQLLESAGETVRLREVYQTVLDRLPFQLGIFDPDGVYTYVNPTAIADPAVREWIVGRSNREYGIRRGLPDAVIAERDALIRRVATTGELVEFDESFTTKTGDLRHFRRTIAPIKDAEGKVVLLLGAGLDITEMRRVEDQLRQSQKMEAVGLLAGGVAHDFNNLLTVVTGIAEVLRADLTAMPDRVAMVDELLGAVKRGSDLTRKLLAFSRRTIVEPRVIELTDAIRQSSVLFGRLLSERITLALDLPEGELNVRIDPGALDQLLFNLAVNARDAMSAGGTFRIHVASERLDAAAAARLDLPAGAYVRLAVSDTGVGMSSAVLARIFEPFFTTKPTGQGTGLGLATVYAIVTQAHGAIRVQSVEGQGATFTIHLPQVSEPARRPSTSGPVDASVARGTERILVAEDEDGVRKLVCRLLKSLGYDVLEARRGEQALALGEAADRLDLLLTDIRMPDLTGIEVADRLREKRPGLRVLFMSGYIDDPDLRTRLATERSLVLDKPFTTAQLAEKVRAALEASLP
ncbi:MAG: ATP-binding protein [Gemmatimonadaceae bacterium]